MLILLVERSISTHATTNNVETSEKVRFTRDYWFPMLIFVFQWLYTADTAMKLQQTQLMLILENTGLPIESKPDVYENVMSAWMSALVTMNNVVGGVAQNICSGGVLLGLSAWHLYPDMVFLGRETTHVQQNDGLISPGGLTTIGMSHSERLDGVSWSMSLAHLKYYGRPVESRGSIGATSTKVSFDKIVYVAIGSMLSDWGDGTLNITSALRFLVALQNCIPAVTARRQAVYEWHLGWFHLLAQHAKSFLDASLPRQEDLTRFVQLGRRRYTNFLCWPQYRPPPFYGLSGPTSFRRIMRTNAWPAINEYLAPVYTPNGAPGLLNVDSLLRSLDLATVDSSKLESYLFSLVSDRRYVAYFESLQALYIASEAYRGLAEAEISLSIADRPLFSTQFGSMATAHKKGMSNVTGNAGLRRHNERLHGTVRMVWMCVDISPGKNVLSNCESCLNRQTYAVNYNAAAHLRRVHFKSDRVEHRELTTRELMKWTRQVEIRIDDSGTLEKSAIQRVDEKLGKESQHLGITSSGHYTMLFACIALFDTGHVDLSQGDLANVFAISTSNSIYIVELLLRDPCTEPTGHAIRRLVGNIGKPGLCLLVSASDALVREPDLDTSNLIHHSPFDGQLEDNFRGTSLHLHLTGYEQPLATREHGVRDEVVKYYQTIISTYDQGIWAADIDLPVFMASRTGSGTPTTPWHSLPRSCTHSEEDRADFSALPHIVTVDNWHELRDPPITISVVRACGNWLARLALAAVVIQQEMSLIVAPEKLCWACAAAKLKELEISNGYENRPLILC